MTNAMKAVESVKSGMSVREALKKHKVPVGAYYKAKSAAQVPAPATEPKIEDTFDSLFETKMLALEELYGIVSAEVYLTALKEIGDWAKKNGRMQ
jgi:hypothetical protein